MITATVWTDRSPIGHDKADCNGRRLRRASVVGGTTTTEVPGMRLTSESIAALKRAMPEGSYVFVVNHRYRSLSGVRRVLRAQAASWCLSFPEGHPKEGDEGGSWLDVPKASEVKYHRHLEDDEGLSVTIYDDDGSPFCTIQPLEGETL